jgi:hypothetical protein
MSYTLIIIDVQPKFPAAKQIKKNCLREIKAAVKDQAHILFLEFDEYGSTYKTLTNYLHKINYEKFTVGIKTLDDGSRVVKNLVYRKRMYRKKFKVAGVNTEFCVLATVEGLYFEFPKANIEVIERACWSAYRHAKGISLMKHLYRVKII